MSKIEIRINTDRAAFRTEDESLETREVAQALREVAAKIEAGQMSGRVFDTNGNASTEFDVEEDA